MDDTLAQAYRQCRDLARSHYENFPVASWLLPPEQRQATAVVYAFARRADDIVDEGNASREVRIQQLQKMQTELERIHRQEPSSDPLFIALNDVVKQFNIPLQPFFDLLTAFTMDVDTNRYASETELLNYCHYSANPVGRIVLYLHRQADAENLIWSDQICTALQLINFIQDIDSDYRQRHRIYIPEDEMRTYQIDESYFQQRLSDAHMQQLVNIQVMRARDLLTVGAPLASRLAGRLGLEIRAIVASAWRMLDKLCLRSNPFDRPKLGIADLPAILGLMLFYTRRIRHVKTEN